jgi:hypothetical protein
LIKTEAMYCSNCLLISFTSLVTGFPGISEARVEHYFGSNTETTASVRLRLNNTLNI